MSRFSGKCDFYDFLFMHGDTDGNMSGEAYRRKVRMFIKNVQIRNESDKDLVPYYPFVGSFGAGRDGATFCFPPMSHVDWMDCDSLSTILAEVNRVYRKMVRKKLPKTADQIVELIGSSFDYLKMDGDDPVRFMAERKIAMGKKANVPMIPGDYRLKIRDMYRQELADEMVKAGYTEKEANAWCFHGKKTWV
jgi:hypothetical protein